MINSAEIIEQSQSIVIKIGSSLLSYGDNRSTAHPLRLEWIAHIIDDIAKLFASGKKVTLVSSGAVAAGRYYMGFDYNKKLTIEQKQVAAACGQPLILASYQNFLDKYQIKSGQILLSPHDLENRRNYLNAKNTLMSLHEMHLLPIVNENDSLATEELRFGDNDRLAARIAQLVQADLLIILSDIDGLYDKPPSADNNAKHIPVIYEISEEIEAMAQPPESSIGSGGMITKIAAARMAMDGGCNMILASGKENNSIRSLMDSENPVKSSIFIANKNPDTAWKQWISGMLCIDGMIMIDEGAVRALTNGNSLLPIGVTHVNGEFDRGDVVEIADFQHRVIGKGIVNYNNEDCVKIIGKHSDEIEAIVGFSGRQEIIHRNNMVVF